MLLPEFGSTKTENQTSQAYDEYSDEERLSEILSTVNGAGKVSVMITYFGTSSYDLSFEEKNSDTTKERSAILDNGTPFIKGKTYPTVKGVIIVSKGANLPSVRESLTSAASAILNVPSYRVCVLEGKERN